MPTTSSFFSLSFFSSLTHSLSLLSLSLSHSLFPFLSCLFPFFFPLFQKTGYYGYVVDVDEFHTPADITLGLRELTNLLKMIDLHPSIPEEARNILKSCDRRLQNAMRSWMVPPCDVTCQLRKPCKQWCENLRESCLNHPAITDILNQGAFSSCWSIYIVKSFAFFFFFFWWISRRFVFLFFPLLFSSMYSINLKNLCTVMQGDSDVRMMAQSMIGKQMKVVDFIVRKLLTCGGNDGGITFSDDMKTCADERNQDFNTCVPENGMMAPLKVEEASVVQPVEKEEEASPTAAAEEEEEATAALVVSPQCIKVTDPLDTKRTYRGTPVIAGLSSIDYLAGVESLHSLLGFVGGEMEKKCIDIAVRATSSWLAPSCSKDCVPRKPCVSWCKRVAKQCFPAHVLGMFGQVELGGTLRSDLESQVTSKTSLLIIDRVLGWISNDCDNSNDFSKKEETCQKEMDTTTCRVPVPATERMTATETSNATTTTTTRGVGGSTSAGGTQHMMATIVEGAVDSAKGEIGSMIPKIENELIKQEDSLAGKLSKAEMSLVGASDENELKTSAASTGEGELTGTQRMMSTVVEGAVDKAKGQIGSLIPDIEREILKQESELETKLGRAEASLTGEKDKTLSNMTVAEEEEEEEEAAAAAAASTSNVSASTLSTPLASSADAAADAATVNNDDDEQDAQVKHHQSLDAASKVNMTTTTTTMNKNTSSITSSSTEQQVEPQVEPQPSRRPSKMKYEDVRKYVPPSWQKDVVVDMEAGVAMRMLDDNAVKPL